MRGAAHWSHLRLRERAILCNTVLQLPVGLARQTLDPAMRWPPFTRLLLEASLTPASVAAMDIWIQAPCRSLLLSPSVSRGHHNPRVQLLERAALALRTRRFAEAEQLAAEVLRANRTDTAAASMLARALLAQNRGEEAIAPLEKAARRNSDAGIETLLGAALGSAGRRDGSDRTIAPHHGAAPAISAGLPGTRRPACQGRTRRRGHRRRRKRPCIGA